MFEPLWAYVQTSGIRKLPKLESSYTYTHRYNNQIELTRRLSVYCDNSSQPPSWIYKKSMTSQAGEISFLQEASNKYVER